MRDRVGAGALKLACGCGATEVDAYARHALRVGALDVVMAVAHHDGVFCRAAELCKRATDEVGLVGLGGVDLAHHGVEQLKDTVVSEVAKGRPLTLGRGDGKAPAGRLELAQKVGDAVKQRMGLGPELRVELAVALPHPRGLLGSHAIDLGEGRREGRTHEPGEVAHELPGDDMDDVAAAIGRVREAGVDLVVCTGGMSVDPDDNTPGAIRRAGAEMVTYGAPVLPGAMLFVGYFDDGTPALGLPGCVMFAGATIFDLVLPRVAAGIRLSRADIVAYGEGGLCLGCDECRYPICPFGK